MTHSLHRVHPTARRRRLVGLSLVGLSLVGLGLALVPAVGGSPSFAALPDAPDTTIASGPADGAIALEPSITYTLASDDADAALTCALDGQPVDCADGTATITAPVAGTHRFTATASNADGSDPSPAARTFTVPYDDTDLKTPKGPWVRQPDPYSFRGTVTTVRGSTYARMVRFVENASAIYLVASTGPNQGSVTMYYLKNPIRTISLKSPVSRRQQVFLVGRTKSPIISGDISIEATNDKPVKIDGLAVVTDPPR